MQNNFTWYLKFHAGGLTIFQPGTTIIKKYNMTSFMYGSLSQFSKFNPRKGPLPPVIWLISRELWAEQAWGNFDFICMVAK